MNEYICFYILFKVRGVHTNREVWVTAHTFVGIQHQW